MAGCSSPLTSIPCSLGYRGEDSQAGLEDGKFQMVLAVLAYLLVSEEIWLMYNVGCGAHNVSTVHTGPLLQLVELKGGTPRSPCSAVGQSKLIQAALASF
jgi:hypothetical protein